MGRAEAAELFDASGAPWSGVAARAASATPALAEHDDLVTERLRLLLHEGAAGADAIRELTGRVDALEARMAADPPPPDAVRELFDRLADDVDSARELEERAVELLSGRHGRPARLTGTANQREAGVARCGGPPDAHGTAGV